MTKAVPQYPLLAVLLSLNILGCSGSGSSGGTLPCVAGEQRACDCVGGARGVQVCRSDGTAFDACTGCTSGGTSSGGTSGGSSTADAWTCSQATRGTNDGCDCGCGATDPDCDNNSCTTAGCFVTGCDYCHNAQGAVVPCGGSPSSSSAAGTSSASVTTTSSSAPSSSAGQASSVAGSSSLPAVSSSAAGSSSLAASGSSGAGGSSAAGSGGSSLGGSGGGGSSGGPSCFECACVQLLSQGGCADLCSGLLNGTGNPNFCDGNNALSQCEACIQSVCGAPSAACGAGGTSSSGGAGSSSSGGVGACDPLAVPGQQGCAPGNKCTWVVMEEVPVLVGLVTCVPDGPVALGGSCTRGAPGPSGFDNCMAGSVCVGSATAGICKDICAPDGTATGACVPGQACVRRSGLFANEGDQPALGACDPTCDPLTQTRLDALGQTVSCGFGQGCYLLASAVDTIAVCAGAGTPTHNQPITGTAFANSCAPGHVPREAVQGTGTRECTALCKPADVFMGNNEAYEGGDSRVLNWMGQPATCESAGGATVLPDVPGTGESCRYFWTRELAPGVTAFSNTLGVCFNHASWTYDSSGMGVGPDLPYPRCINVTTGDVLPPIEPGTGNDAVYFGCMQLPITPAPPAPLLPFSPLLPPAPLRMDMLGPFNR